MHTIAKNLIIGAAMGYGNDQLRNFLRSLREIAFAGKIVLFVERQRAPLPETTLDLTAIEVHSDPGDPQAKNISIARYFWIEEFLDRFPCDGKVMLTDVRDVAFQSDPFLSSYVSGADLLFALEEMTIGACPYNSAWIRRMYGNGVLDDLGGYPIACSGTTIGAYAHVREYVRKMRRHLSDAPDVIGIDQGIHNYLVYRDNIRGQRTGLNGLSFVVTMQYMHRIDVVDGYVLNLDGTPVPVLHQFDRLSLDKQREIRALRVGEA